MSTQLHEILYNDSQDMLLCLSLYRATTTAVQMAAPESEIMDSSSTAKILLKKLVNSNLSEAISICVC
jgi:hypothetical protein